MTLHEKLMELGKRLDDAGQKDDAATVYSAGFKLAPYPKPTVETLTEPASGYYYWFRAWL